MSMMLILICFAVFILLAVVAGIAASLSSKKDVKDGDSTKESEPKV